MILGLCGLACSGKDSFFNFAEEFYKNRNTKCKRFAFADELKKEVNQDLKLKFNISSFTEDKKEKEIIRPHLVEYGMNKRESSNGRYWIDKIQNEVKEYLEKDRVAIITDVRFKNEVDWVNSIGESIYISKMGNTPPNEEEKKNNPIIKKECNHQFVWMDFEVFPCMDAKMTTFNFLNMI
jgi:hypothetical protein